MKQQTYRVAILVTIMALVFSPIVHADNTLASIDITPGIAHASQDNSQNVELVGQIGGVTTAVAVQGNYAYIGVGPRLVILDVSDPAQPTAVGQSEVLPGIVYGVAIIGNYAYVADGYGGLRIINVAIPAASSETSFYTMPDEAYGVAVVGNYAYIADGYGGLRIINVANPAAPNETGFCDTPGYASSVAVAGNYAYIADGYGGLRIINVANPAAPSETGFYTTPGYDRGVAVVGNYAYVADDSDGLRIINVANPAAPSETGFYDTSGYAYSVTVAGNYAYVADWTDGLRIINVTNPAAPSETGFYTTPGDTFGVAVAGNYAYVADGRSGLSIIKVVNPSAPDETGFYDTPDDAFSVAVAGNYAYVAGESGLRIINVANPAAPGETSFFNTPYAVGVAVAGNYAYLTDSGNGGLHLINVTNPATPSETGFYGMLNASGVTIAGNYAYVADYSGLGIINVADPSTPRETGFYDTPGGVWGVAVAGNYAYLADSSNGLRIINVTNPAAPSETGFCDTPGYASSVAVAGGYAYIADDTDGLRIINVANPTAPSETGFYTTSGYARGVAVAGDYAYVADGRSGLRVINVANPAAPSETGFYDMPDGAYSVAVAGDYAYVADGDGGLFILRFTGSVPTFSISGRITDTSSNPIPGITISTNAGLSAVTNANGYYTITNVTTGTYTITPTMSGYSFTPPSRIVSVPLDATGQDFTALLLDTAPPSVINNLTAHTGAAPRQIQFSWTAPGDDGNIGTAAQYDLRYSASPINQTNWSFEAQVSGEPTPGPAGTAQNMTVTLPYAGQLYYFSIKTADDVGNWSGLSNVVSAISASQSDTIPPARILNLTATTGAASGQINLIWTAPGDDGASGTASTYVVKRNSVPINADNWNSSQDVVGVPVPLPAGSNQSMVVSGLTPGQGYYFAMRAYDEVGNYPDASNSAYATAYQVDLPDLIITSIPNVNPAHGPAGATVNVKFTVKNVGNSTAGPHSNKLFFAKNLNSTNPTQVDIPYVVDHLNPGESKDYDVNIRIPSDVIAGQYVIIAETDTFKQVRESDENNNRRDVVFTVESSQPQIDLKIDGIEVTQGIQIYHLDDANYHDPKYNQPPAGSIYSWPWNNQGPGNNQVRLVQGRTTIVRVYVEVTPARDSYDDVSVLLLYNTDAGLVSQRKTLFIRGKPNRQDQNQSFNFVIPGDQLKTVTTLEISAEVDPDHLIPETNESNNTSQPLQVRLIHKDQLTVGVVPIKLVDCEWIFFCKDIGTGQISTNINNTKIFANGVLPFPDSSGVVFRNISPAIEYKYYTCNFPDPGYWILEMLERQRSKYGVDVLVGIIPDAAQSCGSFSATGGSSYNNYKHSAWIRDGGTTGPFALAHELSHLIPGLMHPEKDGTYTCGSKYDHPTWPYDTFALKEVGIAVLFTPTDYNYSYQQGEIVKVKDNHATNVQDIMGYCNYEWVSPYTWEAWISKGKPDNNIFSTLAPNNNSIFISGWVKKDTNTVAFDPIWVSEQPLAPSTESGSYCVQSLDKADTLLDQQCFALDFLDHESGQSKTMNSFLVSLSQLATIAKVRLTNNGTIIGQVVASPNPPTVTLLYPNGGEALDGDFTLSWSGQDVDGDSLAYQVFYSADDGATWLPLTGDISTTTLQLNIKDLPGTQTGRFKVVVSDGFYNNEDQSDGVFSIARKPPVAMIDAILDNISVLAGQVLTLQGTAYDAEDNSLPETAYVWSSNLDGVLGNGSVLATSTLSVGVHLITLTVTDSDGMTNSDSIYLEVLADSDHDGMPDRWEMANGLDPNVNDAQADPDGDGLPNIMEYLYHTDPHNPDTDFDGIDDLTEIIHGTDPLTDSRIKIYLPIMMNR